MILFGVAAGLITSIQLYRGHIFWHIASSYALYIWWYMLRIRPGDPMLGSTSSGRTIIYTIYVLILYIYILLYKVYIIHFYCK